MNRSWTNKIAIFSVTFLFTSFFAIPAKAATSIAIPVPANTSTSTFTTLFSNSDPNFIDGFGDSTQVLVIATATSGSLQLGSSTGLTAVFGYQSPVEAIRALEIRFTGTQIAANAALKTIKYQGDSARTGAATLTITSSVSGGAFNSSNQHYYEFKNLALIWDVSRCVAKYVYTTTGSATEIVDTTTLNNQTVFTKSTCVEKAGYAKTTRTFNGLSGYLATAVDSDENAFITSKAGSAAAWLGGSDLASDQVWKWIDGPEAGQTFWTTGLPLRTTNTIDGAQRFNNWNNGEPNGPGGGEDALQILSGGTGEWNDLDHTNSTTLPFIIEFGAPGETLATANATANKVLTIISAPIAPTISSVTAGNTQVTVNFTAPADTGGSAISDYEYSTNNGSTWTTSGSTASPITITGLTNSTTYQIKVRAINTTGNGTASSATPGIPVATVPAAPAITSITAGNSQLSVSFSAPTNPGTSAISDYEYSTDNGSTWTLSGSITSPITITGLTNNTTYQVKLRAKNTSGSGNPSSASSGRPVGPASSSGGTATPTPTPTSTRKPKPVNNITPNPSVSPTVKPEPGSFNQPAPLAGRIIDNLIDQLKPVTVNIFAPPTPPADQTSFSDQNALDLISGRGDKKIGNDPSLVLYNNQYQPSKMVIVDNNVAQVVAPDGGVLNVQVKDGETPIAVNAEGRVQIMQSNLVYAQGNGLASNSEFAVYMFSNPTLLGVGKTNAKGEFFVFFPVNKQIPIGDHTLQVNGLLADGRTSSVSMPVSVVDSVAIEAMPNNVFVDENPVTKATNTRYYLIALLLFMLFGGSRLWLAALRRKEEEQS